MTISALLLLWVTWNLFWAQEMNIVKQLRKKESASQVVGCCCFDTTFGQKVGQPGHRCAVGLHSGFQAVRLNRFQAVMGCLTSSALIVLSVITMRVNAAVHFDAAIIFFITSSLQFWANFVLQYARIPAHSTYTAFVPLFTQLPAVHSVFVSCRCTITDTTVWGQISGSNIAPRTLGVKRWIIRSV